MNAPGFVAAFVLAVIFALLTGVLAMIAVRVHRGQVAPTSMLGDVPARAAAYFGAAGAVSLIQTLAFAGAALYPPLATPGYLATLTVTGLVLVGVLIWLGVRHR